jgi:hypothetical protein
VVAEQDRGVAQVVEVADAATEQDRHQADTDGVEQPEVQALLGDAGAGDPDDLAARGGLSLRDRAPDPPVTKVNGAPGCSQASGAEWVTT